MREKSKQSKALRNYMAMSNQHHVDCRVMDDAEIAKRMNKLSRAWYALSQKERDFCNSKGL